MKKKLVSLVLCMALLSSLTVGASAEFSSEDSSNLSKILGYLAPDVYNRNATIGDVLSEQGVFNNTTYQNVFRMLGPALTSIYNSNAGIAQRIVEVQTLITGTNNRVDTTNSRLSTINTNMQNLIAAFSSQNHTDITAFADANHSDLTAFKDANHTDITAFSTLFDKRFSNVWYSSDSDNAYASYRLYGDTSAPYKYMSWSYAFSFLLHSLSYDGRAVSVWPSERTLFSRIKQLQEVLASDDDLALKNANKANEAAVKSDFVNGSSSKTSLGVSDFGNLKDVGGTFNDLTSLNGQSSISSFLSGITSADTTGQGWFSETTRASLDAVSTPVSSARLVRKTWRGEKSLIYTLEADTSVSGVRSVAGVAGSDVDPFNMAGFTDNYNWLWGDAS